MTSNHYSWEIEPVSLCSAFLATTPIQNAVICPVCSLCQAALATSCAPQNQVPELSTEQIILWRHCYAAASQFILLMQNWAVDGKACTVLVFVLHSLSIHIFRIYQTKAHF